MPSIEIYTPEKNYERNMQRRRFIFFTVLLAITICIGFRFIISRGKDNAIAGLSAPVQTEASGGTSMKLGKYDIDISYIASYDIDALVISTHDYHGSGLDSKLVPRDIALAWGKVAEYNTRINFNWSQSGRFCRYTLTGEDYIKALKYCPDHAAEISNNHLIASDRSIKSKINKIRRGDHIRIQGYLVNINATHPDKGIYHWNSSTTRTDSGNGACELIYVTAIDWK